MNVWQPLIDEQFKNARAEGREEPLAAYAFDALMELAELAGAPAEPDPTQRRTRRQRSRSRSGRPRSISRSIRLDYEALVRGAVEGEETCEIAGLGPIPVRIARELLGDAILKLVITKGVDVVNVTHLGRSPTMAQQVALLWQSPECTREGCTRTQRLENDHRDDWAKTKHTRLDEPRPALRPRPRPQDLPRLGPRQRQRQTANGPTRRPPPPQLPSTTDPTADASETFAAPSRVRASVRARAKPVMLELGDPGRSGHADRAERGTEPAAHPGLLLGLRVPHLEHAEAVRRACRRRGSSAPRASRPVPFAMSMPSFSFTASYCVFVTSLPNSNTIP